jgi:hypothetical protein
MNLKKWGIIGVIIGIPLLIYGIKGALEDFESQMNLIDWLVMDVAPSLSSTVGDLVRVLAICLLIFFATALPATIERLAKEYT